MGRQRAYRAVAGMIMSLLILLEVFVALRLDRSIDWSWHAVLAPWSFLELGAIVRKFTLMGNGGDNGLPAVGWNIVRLAMAFTIASKLNGSIQDWYLVFIPYFFGIAISFLLLCRQCYSREAPPEGELSPQQAACTGMCSL